MCASSDIQISFFGSSSFSATALDSLESHGFVPARIIASPDKPFGRKWIITPPKTKTWAAMRAIQCDQPERLSEYELPKCDLIIVASYAKIIPKRILEIPRFGALNIHPSLLPRYRGPTPIQSAILAGDTESGVTIMEMDEEMDHGAIVAQSQSVQIDRRTYQELEKDLARIGGNLLAETIYEWIEGNAAPKPQNHKLATYTKKFSTNDGLIDLKNPERSDRIVRALNPNPGAYLVFGGKRIRVISGKIANGTYEPVRVIPEGRREMEWSEFLRGRNQNGHTR